MDEVSTIGLDIAKSVFQVHGVDRDGTVVIRKRVNRANVLEFFADLPSCLVGIEVCPSGHYWGRQLQALGHTVRLLPPSYVKAYLKCSKNDANDAAAICEAVTRPSMRFVPIKSEQQQSGLILHRSRQLLVRQRTMLSNAIRGHMAELGLIAAKGRNGTAELLKIIASTEDNRVPEAARFSLEVLAHHYQAIAAEIGAIVCIPARRPCKIWRLLQSDAPTPCFAQGCAVTAWRTALRHHCRHSNPWRIASPLRPDLIFGRDRWPHTAQIITPKTSRSSSES